MIKSRSRRRSRSRTKKTAPAHETLWKTTSGCCISRRTLCCLENPQSLKSTVKKLFSHTVVLSYRYLCNPLLASKFFLLDFVLTFCTCFTQKIKKPFVLRIIDFDPNLSTYKKVHIRYHTRVYCSST